MGARSFATRPARRPGIDHARRARSAPRIARTVAPLLAGALVVAACSGDDNDASGATTTPAPSTTSAVTTTTSTTTTTIPPTTTTTPKKRSVDPCKAAAKRRQHASPERRAATDGDGGQKRREPAQKPSQKEPAKKAGKPKRWIIGGFVTATTAPKRGDDKRAHETKDARDTKDADRASDRGNRPSRDAHRPRCAAPKPQSKPKPKPKKEKPAPLRRMPLTGRILGKDEAVPQHPALVVKIDNHPDARPQYGLNSADIVFEEIVEWGTRFAAVFHSEGSNPVGPIRSGRTQDINMLARLNRPLFAWSGGNPNVTTAIANSNLVDLNAAFAGGYYRGAGYAPHNLFNTTDALWSQTPPDWQQPGQYFDYLEPGESFPGPPAAGVEVNLDSMTAWWGWNPEEQAYVRATSGSPHYDGHGGQVRARNVVVLQTNYFPSPADARSPEAQSIGSGTAWVFSSGHVVKGMWTRGGPTSPYLLKTADGKHVIELRSGRTFVELAETAVDGEPRILPVPEG